MRQRHSKASRVLDRFLSFDGWLGKLSGIPLMVRCMGSIAFLTGPVGGFSYIMGAAIENQSIIPEFLCIVIGGSVAGAISGIMVVVVSSVSSSRSLIPAMFLQVLVFFLFAFAITPILGTFLLSSRVDWQSMYVCQLIGFAFLLVLATASIYFYRKFKRPRYTDTSNTSELDRLASSELPFNSPG